MVERQNIKQQCTVLQALVGETSGVRAAPWKLAAWTTAWRAGARALLQLPTSSCSLGIEHHKPCQRILLMTL